MLRLLRLLRLLVLLRLLHLWLLLHWRLLRPPRRRRKRLPKRRLIAPLPRRLLPSGGSAPRQRRPSAAAVRWRPPSPGGRCWRCSADIRSSLLVLLLPLL
jgi:hypothetical protein